MNLYEHEAKEILRATGIAVPAGQLWPVDLADVHYPAVLKAQILEGGRGRRGGIRFIEGADRLSDTVADLMLGSSSLPPADAVLVEPRITCQRELFVAIALDRNSGVPVLLASPKGGIDVEEASEGDLLRVPLSIGSEIIPAFVVRTVERALGLAGSRALPTVLQGLWDVFRKEDCLIVEINPLGYTPTGRLVALDARIALDDSAAYRHPDRPQRKADHSFEAVCSALGVAAAEMDGDIAVVASGAGLGMATLDMLSNFNATARCMVDLGGTVFQHAASRVEVFRLIQGLKPKALLLTAFLQLADCQDLIKDLVEAEVDGPSSIPIVIRLRGNNEVEARVAASELHHQWVPDMLGACRTVSELANARGTAMVGA